MDEPLVVPMDSLALNSSFNIHKLGKFEKATNAIRTNDHDLRSDSCSLESLFQSPILEPAALPGAIANALVHAYEGLSNFSLTDNARRVFACLIRYGLNLKDINADVFIKKSTIALKLKLSEATIYRALTVLENAKLIVRHEQEHFKAISTIAFTQVALEQLGLKNKKPAVKIGSDQERHQVSAESGIAPVRDVNSEPIQSFSKRQSERGAFKKIGHQSVPSDLAWLITEKSLSPNGLFGLMRIAKTHGHRLSDVVAHTASAIRSPKIQNVFAYLRALLSKPVDYAFLAARALDEKVQRAADAKSAHERRREEALLSVLIGETFSAPDGSLWTVDEGVFSTMNRGIRSSLPYQQAPAIVRSITRGEWPKKVSGCGEANVVNSTVCEVTTPSTPDHARRMLASLRGSLLRVRSTK